MRPVIKFCSAVLMGAVLTACLEPQSAPELPARPSSDFTLTTIAEGLDAPLSVEVLPDGGPEAGYLVTGKHGQLWRISAGAKTEISGMPDDIYSEGQAGVFDIRLAPDFARTREVYLSYAYGTSAANGTALLRAKLSGDALTESNVIFRASPPKAAASHFGGRIEFLPDATLVLTLGEGFAYREDAQKPGTHLGKIVRLTRNGGTPPDNPFLGQSDYKSQIYSVGHRNVQGVDFDAVTNTLWAHEHGPRGGDEINKITAGENYGWPIATQGRDYQGARISPFETYAGMTPPVHSWTPSIAPSGLVIYRGDAFPDWQGEALVGGLASGDLRRVNLQAGAEVRLLADGKTEDDTHRIRDVDVDAQGHILLLVNHSAKDGSVTGRLVKMGPKI